MVLIPTNRIPEFWGLYRERLAECLPNNDDGIRMSDVFEQLATGRAHLWEVGECVVASQAVTTHDGVRQFNLWLVSGEQSAEMLDELEEELAGMGFDEMVMIASTEAVAKLASQRGFTAQKWIMTRGIE